ncbi:disulfide reductase [Desulfopila sp. IMCC35006]|uniref:CoB--CoM heterodisulfide reductase iron-sulfur subunit B family protein n=1 Tax=Desulfopila sp. IMCC35006 TaxID=2569542 RepID=UPI0010AC705A|nr:CoB--CoM heterodisulfide reductase iron-sulfur subunit B family protein [Desulfopila sp. IMCC35006]TKB27958.1 disulfide reductase [Desulfopila sp. IMCC35006]
MKYAFFQGCNIPIRIKQYATSTEAVLNTFGVELEVVPDFNCCGYPARNVDEKAYLLPSVRNMAIAEKMGLDIAVICNCCFASLQKAKSVMAGNSSLQDELNGFLSKESLQYSGKVQIKHFLTVLYEDIGIEQIKSRLVNRIKDLNISVIHGCHILRPREITSFDDSFVPRITDELVQLTGVTSLDWRGKLECCGAALAGINTELSHKLLQEKISGAEAAGANYITPVCSYCHLQFDTTQKTLHAADPAGKLLPVLLYPQLLGLCLGIDEQLLGIHQNSTIGIEDIQHLKSLLGPPGEEKKKAKKKAAAAA